MPGRYFDEALKAQKKPHSSLALLEAAGPQFFIDLFGPPTFPDAVGSSWLYEPLRQFLRSVCERGNGVLVFWET